MLLLASHVVLLLEGGGVGFVDFIRVCAGVKGFYCGFVASLEGLIGVFTGFRGV